MPTATASHRTSPDRSRGWPRAVRVVDVPSAVPRREPRSRGFTVFTAAERLQPCKALAWGLTPQGKVGISSIALQYLASYLLFFWP